MKTSRVNAIINKIFPNFSFAQRLACADVLVYNRSASAVARTYSTDEAPIFSCHLEQDCETIRKTEDSVIGKFNVEHITIEDLEL